MKLIPLDAVLAEINRLIAELVEKGENTMFEQGRISAFEDVKLFLDILEVKEVDLNEYYHDFLQKEWFDKNCSRTVSEMMAFTAKHFFELGVNASNPLTWEDIRLIAEIGDKFMNSEESDNLSEEDYYKEILKRFKAQKGE